jgi:AcrR family transcriptional regulator
MAAPLHTDIRKTISLATSKLLETTPFGDISLAAIAGEAGISKGTLYYYYKNKEDILYDIAGRFLDELARRLEEWTGDANKDTSYPRFLRYVLQFGLYDETGGVRLHLLVAALPGGELREKMLAQYARFEKMLADKIAERRPNADAGHVAWQLLTLMDGLMIQKQMQNPRLDVDAFIEETVKTMAAESS